jgi:hypothetical protein
MYKWIISGLIGIAMAGSTAAMDLRYYTRVGLVGTFVDRQGIDCCMNGKEKKVNFPALLLDSPINVTAADPLHPDEDEMPEQDARLLQLVLRNKEHWALFKQNKGKKVRVTCSLFHSSTGHHLTPVLCDVEQIHKADQY